MTSEFSKFTYKLETKLNRISRVKITKDNYEPDEITRIPFNLKLPEIPYDVDYIKPIPS